MPVALLLLRRDATVTIVHSKTQNPEQIVREADIVIAAAGQAEFVRGNWIKPGAAVIDVGTNPVDVRIRERLHFPPLPMSSFLAILQRSLIPPNFAMPH